MIPDHFVFADALPRTSTIARSITAALDADEVESRRQKERTCSSAQAPARGGAAAGGVASRDNQLTFDNRRPAADPVRHAGVSARRLALREFGVHESCPIPCQYGGREEGESDDRRGLRDSYAGGSTTDLRRSRSRASFGHAACRSRSTARTSKRFGSIVDSRTSCAIGANASSEPDRGVRRSLS
jgi:hypothetical protein